MHITSLLIYPQLFDVGELSANRILFTLLNSIVDIHSKGKKKHTVLKIEFKIVFYLGLTIISSLDHHTAHKYLTTKVWAF